MAAIHLTRKDFLEKVVNYEKSPEWNYLGDRPAIIDFYATWCGPCKSLSPVLDELASEYEGKVYIYKVDVDAESELASVFGIRSVPSLVFVPLDAQPSMLSGALPKDSLKKIIGERFGL